MDTPIRSRSGDGQVVPFQQTPDGAAKVPTAETYAALQRAFDHLNAHLFGGTLPNCLVTLQRRKGAGGYFRRAPFARTDGAVADEIAMAPALFHEAPVAEVLAELAHDMVHLWQHAFGRPGRPRYHNREWAAKMRAIGLHPTATGTPDGKATGERMTQLVIPDGAFARAVAALIDDGFTIPWAERASGEDDTDADADAEDDGTRRAGKWFKYVCPTCGMIARARHGARLVCGSDLSTMEPGD